MFDPDKLDDTVAEFETSVSKISGLSESLEHIDDLTKQIKESVKKMEERPLPLDEASLSKIRQDHLHQLNSLLAYQREDLEKAQDSIRNEIKTAEESTSQNLELQLESIIESQEALLKKINEFSEGTKANISSAAYGIGEVKGQITANSENLKSFEQTTRAYLSNLDNKIQHQRWIPVLCLIINFLLLGFMIYKFY